MKLYVGNFSFDMTERTLRELFEPFGTVSEVKLITDRETGQSRGFGFVTMGNVSEGNAAIQGLDGKDKGGRKLKVNEARPKDDRGGRPSLHECLCTSRCLPLPARGGAPAELSPRQTKRGQRQIAGARKHNER
jgi:RNA recognition motif-containing protein